MSFRKALHLRDTLRQRGVVAALTFALLPWAGACAETSQAQMSAPSGQAQSQAGAQPVPPGTPYTTAQLASLLPSSVYFGGRTAPLQLRNAGAVSFGAGAIVWAALVDASGYATGVQEKYQFYLVTETPIRVGQSQLPAGAYGGGFVGERFVLMDIGGHSVAEGTTERDAALPRPRPLQLLPVAPDSMKLYLGKRYVQLHAR